MSFHVTNSLFHRLAQANALFPASFQNGSNALSPATGLLAATRRGNKLNFVQRYLSPLSAAVINNSDQTISTHRMASAEVDGKQIAYPTIVDVGDGKLIQLDDDAAFAYALQTGEYLEFPSRQEAESYASGGYKHDFGALDKIRGLKK